MSKFKEESHNGEIDLQNLENQSISTKKQEDFFNFVKIEKIYLENFLSFECDEIILDPYFSIIWGPNGAGKSSIYQALKFTLGSNNYDGRYKKWSDFIRTGQKMAKVRVYFDINGEKYVIQRTVRDKITPKYSIKNPDDKDLHNTTSSTISNLLQRIKINPDNVFSFMSQGNIDSIKDFKETTLCDFVENGIGLKGIREQILEQKCKIEDLQKKQAALLSRKSNLHYSLIELQPKLKKLDKKHNILKNRKKLDDQLLIAKKKDIIKQIEDYQKDIETNQMELHDLDNKTQIITKTIENIRNQREVKEEEFNNIRNEYSIKKVRKDVVENEIKQKTSEKNEIGNKIHSISESIKQMKNDLNQDKTELSTIEQKTTQIEEFIKNTDQEIQKLMDEERKINQEFLQNQKILLEFETKRQNITFKQERIKDLNLEHNDIEKDINKKIQLIQEIDHELHKFKWFLKDPRENLKDKMIQQNEVYQEQIETYTQKLSEFQNQYQMLTKSLNSVKQAVFDKAIPKPESIQNIMKEIKERKLKCIGPFIDFITFDEIYQPAIESIFGYRVLYSFMTTHKESFHQLTQLAYKYRAKINIYLERDQILDNLPPLPMSTNPDVLGYLASKIQPISSDNVIKKVITSVANRTLVVKDHATGTDYIDHYKFDSWIVTLDGEQIRPKKGLVEARPFIPQNKNITSAAQARQQFEKFTAELDINRNNYNSLRNRLEEIKIKHTKIQSYLQQIDRLLAEFKRKQIATSSKNHLVEKREEKFLKIQNITNDIHQIQNEIEEIKPKLPKETIEKQIRLHEIPKLMTNLQKNQKQYMNSSQNYQKQILATKTHIATLETEIKLNEQEKIELETKLKTQDNTFFQLFQENINLANEIDNLNQVQKELKKNIKEIDESLKDLNVEICTHIKDKLKIEANIEELDSKIREKTINLEYIQEKLLNSEAGIKNEKIRSIYEIEEEIRFLDKILLDFADVDDSLIKEKEEIELNISNIVLQHEQLNLEINAAIDAEKVLELNYHERFEFSLEKLTHEINAKLSLTSLPFHVNLNLYGPIQELGLQINTFFIDETNNSTLYPLSALSGGQRSMVGICLMLSLNALNPSPFNIYDEAEMFLDAKNAQTVAKLIHNLTLNGIQFVILMPDKSKTLVQLADKVIGVSRNGKSGPSTVHYGIPIKNR